MAHGHRPTVVQLIKYLRKLWEGTGKALGSRVRLAATIGGGGTSTGHAPGHWASGSQMAMLLDSFWALTCYHFLAYFLSFRSPAVPSS